MGAISTGSVTQMLQQLRDGEASMAQQALWERYFRRLAGIARKKLNEAGRRVVDEDDIALSTLDSFFQATEQGRYPDLADRTELWPLLAQIAVCKALKQRERMQAAKRGGGKVRGDSVVDEFHFSGATPGFDRFFSDEPTPDSVAELKEMVHGFMNKLEDESLRSVAELKLSGHTNREIADKLDVSERTVERKLVRTRTFWTMLCEEPV